MTGILEQGAWRVYAADCTGLQVMHPGLFENEARLIYGGYRTSPTSSAAELWCGQRLIDAFGGPNG